jgi:hypothetical protein
LLTLRRYCFSHACMTRGSLGIFTRAFAFAFLGSEREGIQKKCDREDDSCV